MHDIRIILNSTSWHWSYYFISKFRQNPAMDTLQMKTSATEVESVSMYVHFLKLYFQIIFVHLNCAWIWRLSKDLQQGWIRHKEEPWEDESLFLQVTSWRFLTKISNCSTNFTCLNCMWIWSLSKDLQQGWIRQKEEPWEDEYLFSLGNRSKIFDIHRNCLTNFTCLNCMWIWSLAKDLQQGWIRHKEEPWEDESLFLQVTSQRFLTDLQLFQ